MEPAIERYDRVVWYLNLRGIPYSECVSFSIVLFKTNLTLTSAQSQPFVMPRPDVAALGIQYRRIPLLAIGRDVYNDTRLILSKLEDLFPNAPRISASSPDQKSMERLLEYWTVDSGVFMRASQLMPTSMPLLKDEKFMKDREQLTGRSWTKEGMEEMRPEALAEIRNAFEFLETTLLADGRDWVLKTDRPSLADIEGKSIPHTILRHHANSCLQLSGHSIGSVASKALYQWTSYQPKSSQRSSPGSSDLTRLSLRLLRPLANQNP